MSSPLICKEVYYYSQLDEDMFFAWLDRIPCIDRYEGKGDSLYIYLKDKALTYEDIKNLIALFYRYQITMKQLKAFQNKENEMAFRPVKRIILEFNKPENACLIK